jgi:hypothetical protein
VIDQQVAAIVLVGLIAATAAVIAAVIASRSAQQARRANRGEELENLLVSYKKDNQLMYLYNRDLIDHIYSGKGRPPPPPPEGLFV